MVGLIITIPFLALFEQIQCMRNSRKLSCTITYTAKIPCYFVVLFSVVRIYRKFYFCDLPYQWTFVYKRTRVCCFAIPISWNPARIPVSLKRKSESMAEILQYPSSILIETLEYFS